MTRTFLLSFLLFSYSLVNAATIFSFDSSNTSWVGQGESIYVTPEDGYIFTSGGNENHVSVSIASLNSPFGPNWNPSSGDPYNYWTLDLAAPFNNSLAIEFYDETARYPFQDTDQAGLTLSGNHRGNNRNGGFFNILEINFDTSGTLQLLAVDFTQYGEQQEGNWITGSLRYNSDIAIVPIPAAMWLFCSALFGLVNIRKTRTP